MAFWSWSKTAASNSNADSSINWAEGQAPSSVNDSARAMMARAAEYRDDTSGSLTTGGSSTAYTISTNEVFDTLAHLSGHKLKVQFHATNGASPTLNVDGLGAKALAFATSLTPPVGSILAGSYWDVTYNNGGAGFFFVSGGSAAAITPIGFIGDFAGSTAPPLWLLCFGQAISRTTYAALFNTPGIGTTYGVGDGSTTFNLPDYRGRVLAGVDNMGGSAANRIGSVVTDNGTIVGATLGSTGGSATHVQTNAEMAQHTHTVTDPGHAHTVTQNANSTGGGNQAPISGGPTYPANAAATITVNSNTTGITNQNSGSSNAMAWLQPTAMTNKIIFAGV
jgi:microcystin-dependent protein